MSAPDELFPSASVANPAALRGRPNRGLSPKQNAVIEYLSKYDSISLDFAVALIGGDLYANAREHVGALLANMVRRGLIVRVKPGIFKLAEVSR